VQSLQRYQRVSRCGLAFLLEVRATFDLDVQVIRAIGIVSYAATDINKHTSVERIVTHPQGVTGIYMSFPWQSGLDRFDSTSISAT